LTGVAGFTIHPGTHTLIDTYAQRVSMNDMSTTAPRAGRLSVNLSGTIFGARLTFFY
jgi:hypothetical protein